MSNVNDKNNEPRSRTQTIIRALLFIAVITASAAALISLKQLTADGPLTPDGIAARDSLHNIAHPDTTEATDEITPTPAVHGVAPNAAGAPVDTILTSGDARSPIDAGYEDGYYAGIIDGVSGDERASYDESSQFPDAKQRQSYTDAYRRGYAQGFKDGMDGKEFSIVPQQDNDPEDEEADEPEPATTPAAAPAKTATTPATPAKTAAAPPAATPAKTAAAPAKTAATPAKTAAKKTTTHRTTTHRKATTTRKRNTTRKAAKTNRHTSTRKTSTTRKGATRHRTKK